MLLIKVYILGAETTQIPMELLACEPICAETLPFSFMIDCHNGTGPLLWKTNLGRTLWGPLRNVGPIRIAVQARPVPVPTLPLYAEIVAREASGGCVYEPGVLYWKTFGTVECDSLGVTSPRIDLRLSYGETYWLQLVGFYQIGPDEASSPFVRCVRITSYPSPVHHATWNQVKQLYR